MKAGVDVTIKFEGVEIVVGNNNDHGGMTPDEAKRLAQLLELAANAVEKAEEMGENDE